MYKFKSKKSTVQNFLKKLYMEPCLKNSNEWRLPKRIRQQKWGTISSVTYMHKTLAIGSTLVYVQFARNFIWLWGDDLQINWYVIIEFWA